MTTKSKGSKAMNTQQALNELSKLQQQRVKLNEQQQAAIPDEIKQVLDDIAAEFAPKAARLDERIASLEQEIKQAVVKQGEPVTGDFLQAVYMPGRVTWNTDGLTGLAIQIPAIEQFKKVGEPYATIRAVKPK